jgi:biopolymer transport protein ExbB
MSFTFLQINVLNDTLQQVADKVDLTVQEGLSFWSMALKGGWIMIIILLFSIIASYIFFERFLIIRRALKLDDHFMDTIKKLIKDGKVEDALSHCDSYDHPLSRMIKKGILRIGKPMKDVNVAIENVGKLEVAKLEKGLTTLATTAGAAPMIGFLGTVMGMIRSFYDMANVEGGNISVSLLSNGIYTAMVTTVGGLIVGILAYLAYNYLVARVENVVNQLEAATMDFMDLLNAPAE